MTHWPLKLDPVWIPSAPESHLRTLKIGRSRFRWPVGPSPQACVAGSASLPRWTLGLLRDGSYRSRSPGSVAQRNKRRGYIGYVIHLPDPACRKTDLLVRQFTIRIVEFCSPSYASLLQRREGRVSRSATSFVNISFTKKCSRPYYR
jgi:hypothetical protein